MADKDEEKYISTPEGRVSLQQECRFLTSFETTSHKRRRRIFSYINLVIGLFLVHLCIASYHFIDVHYNDSQMFSLTDPNVGTAQTLNCERTDWITTLMHYPGWDCDVRVRWNRDGTSETYHTKDSRFTPDLIGKTISVYHEKETIGGTAATRHSNHFITQNRQRPLLSWQLPISIGILLIGALFLGNGLLKRDSYYKYILGDEYERKKLRKKLVESGQIREDQHELDPQQTAAPPAT